METSAEWRNTPSIWLTAHLRAFYYTDKWWNLLSVQRLLFIYGGRLTNDSQVSVSRTNLVTNFSYLKKGTLQMNSVDEFSHPKKWQFCTFQPHQGQQNNQTDSSCSLYGIELCGVFLIHSKHYCIRKHIMHLFVSRQIHLYLSFLATSQRCTKSTALWF